MKIMRVFLPFQFNIFIPNLCHHYRLFFLTLTLPLSHFIQSKGVPVTVGIQVTWNDILCIARKLLWCVSCVSSSYRSCSVDLLLQNFNNRTVIWQIFQSTRSGSEPSLRWSRRGRFVAARHAIRRRQEPDAGGRVYAPVSLYLWLLPWSVPHSRNIRILHRWRSNLPACLSRQRRNFSHLLANTGPPQSASCWA